MSASLATLNMVILWTVILAAVVAWISRRIGFLRSERDVEMRMGDIEEMTREDRDTCGILGPEFRDGLRLSLDRLDESFGHHLP